MVGTLYGCLRNIFLPPPCGYIFISIRGEYFNNRMEFPNVCLLFFVVKMYSIRFLI